MRQYKREDLPWLLYRATIYEDAGKRPIASWFALSEFLIEFEKLKLIVTTENCGQVQELYANSVSNLEFTVSHWDTTKRKGREEYLSLGYIDLDSLREAVTDFLKIPVFCPFLGKALLTLILGGEAGSFSLEIKRANPSKLGALLRGLSKELEKIQLLRQKLVQLYMQTLEPTLSYPVLREMMLSAANAGCFVNPLAHAIVDKALKESSL